MGRGGAETEIWPALDLSSSHPPPSIASFVVIYLWNDLDQMAAAEAVGQADGGRKCALL
jgi:hypothetical protein